MLKNGTGAVVNVSSGAAVSDEVPQLPYGCTKAALERFTVGLGHQFAGSGVGFYGVRIDELVPTEAVTYSMPDGLSDMAICPPEAVARAIVDLIKRPDLSGQILGHAQLRELASLMQLPPQPPKRDLDPPSGLPALRSITARPPERRSRSAERAKIQRGNRFVTVFAATKSARRAVRCLIHRVTLF